MRWKMGVGEGSICIVFPSPLIQCTKKINVRINRPPEILDIRGITEEAELKEIISAPSQEFRKKLE
jgi:hypothetical protein